MKYLILSIWFAGLGMRVALAFPATQDTSSAYIASLNAFIDHSVVSKNKAALDTLYADDFMFTHGTGHIDSKASWLKGIMDPQTVYISREHDSVVVERHDHIAMIYGKLTITRKDGEGRTKYAIKYVRVYLYQNNRWQMISHRTVQQWNNLPLT
jgi:hypothetical protein